MMQWSEMVVVDMRGRGGERRHAILAVLGQMYESGARLIPVTENDDVSHASIPMKVSFL